MGPFNQPSLILISASMDNHTLSKELDEINYYE